MNYGVQLYSVRDSVKENGMRETLRRVAEIGYKSVEFAGFGDATAEEVRVWLDEFGLSVNGSHNGIKDLMPDKIEKTIADMKAVGNTHIIIPWARVRTQADIDEFLASLTTALPRLREAGFSVGFHNHDKEYLENEDGIVPMSLLEGVDGLFFELDTYWAYHAGLDPVTEMERMGDRLKMIHIKDGIPALGYDGGKPLGQGTAPIKAVWEKAVALGLPIIVESETLTPDGMTEITQCIEYLRSLEL